MQHLGGREKGRRAPGAGETRPCPRRTSGVLPLPRVTLAVSFSFTPQMSEARCCPCHILLSLLSILAHSLPPSLSKLPGGRASSCPWAISQRWVHARRRFASWRHGACLSGGVEGRMRALPGASLHPQAGPLVPGRVPLSSRPRPQAVWHLPWGRGCKADLRVHPT